MSYKAKGILSLKHRKNLSLSHKGQIPVNKKVIPKKDLVLLYIKQNKSTPQIAKIYECTYQTILRNLKEYKIPIKNISEGTKSGMNNKEVIAKILKKSKGTHRSLKTEFKKGHKRLIIKGEKYDNHHIYLKGNSTKTMKLTSKKHGKLHCQAYEYLVEIGLIDKYIKWFDKKYGLK